MVVAAEDMDMEDAPQEEGTMVSKSVREMLDISKAKLIDNKDLVVKVYRDKKSGEMYACLQDSKNSETSILITAEAVFHLAEVVDKVFNTSATSPQQETLH
jgi:hypothetical protein